MTELEKLRKGEYYRMNDTEIDNIQTRAITYVNSSILYLSPRKKNERTCCENYWVQ